jgi:argininosuccinate synthase
MSESSSAASKDVVLAFSGGLDTSFCIPYLQERGYAVHSVFADTGGVDAEERAYIEARAAELGAASHVTVDGGPSIWSGFVKPFVWAGEGYQGQYPLLVSDRYLIVEAALKRCAEIGTRLIAHGCTGMGNDQVRFDLAVKALGDYEILAGEDAEFGRRLSEFKVTSEVHSLPQTQHSFILGAGRVPETDKAIEHMGQWLHRHVGH